MRKLSDQDMKDLLSGGLILGCGGGGEPRTATALIEEVYRNGKDFCLVDVDEIDEEGIYCLVSYVGGGISEEENTLIKGLKSRLEHPIHKAAQELS